MLSWISESEDMFEDTGASKEETDGSEFEMIHYSLSCMNVMGEVCNSIHVTIHFIHVTVSREAKQLRLPFFPKIY